MLFDFDGTQVDDGLSCQVDDKVKILEEYDDWYWVRLGDQVCVLGGSVTDRRASFLQTTSRSDACVLDVRSRMVQNKTLPLPREKEVAKESSPDVQKADPEPISSYGTARTYVGQDCVFLEIGVQAQP